MTLDFLKLLKPRGSSVMGLTIEGRRLEGFVLSRGKGSLEAGQSFEALLSLDPLTNDPELVGQEIRNRLDEAGIHESRCAVGVPLNWTLTLPIKLPEIPEEDVSSFLSIQAERGFPYSPEDLRTATSRCRSAKDGQYATLVAIPRDYLARLDQVLVAARLKPVSFSLLVAALQLPSAAESEGVLALVVGENRVDLQITCGGGVVALRSLEGAIEMENGHRQIDTDLLTREIRLTLGQLPTGFREAVTRIKVFGRTEWIQPLADEIAVIAERMGLPVELRPVTQVDGVGALASIPESAPPALVMALRCLEVNPTGFEFLPPKVSPLMELAARFSSRRILWSSATAGSAVLLILLAFLVQYTWLSILESRWHAIEPRVTEIDGMQQNIRKFRPWFDSSARTLTILKNLTQAFPEDGVVSVKTLEIKDLSDVSCSGVADDNQALLKLLDRLRAANHVEDVKVQSVRGKSPLQFTFDFHWSDGATHEN
jgi:hypothetical protein